MFVRLMQRLGALAILTARALLTPVAFGVCAFVERDGNILLVRHSYARGWSLPGGGVKRGEPPVQAVLRELKEEVGLIRSGPPEFFGLYTRKGLWATNVVAMYRVPDVEIEFKPNFEVREIHFADPGDLPRGTSAGTRRRIAELIGGTPRSPYW
jgi:ADP-ribose pyrophosphatase YjhB (NUDIX family)